MKNSLGPLHHYVYGRALSVFHSACLLSLMISNASFSNTHHLFISSFYPSAFITVYSWEGGWEAYL